MTRASLVCVAACAALVLCVAPLWAALGGPSGILIPYKGRLEVNGSPVTSSQPYAFHVTIYDAATGGTVCPTAYDATSPVTGGVFSVVIGPVAPACVTGKKVFLSVSVAPPGGGAMVALVGRQQVFPAVAALTSGEGDFSTNGNVGAISLSVSGAGTVSGTLNVGTLVLNAPGGVIALNDQPLLLRGPADTNHALVHRGTFAGTSLDGPALYGYGGGLLGTTAGGERTALSWDNNGNVGVPGNVSIAGTGGNVPHACVVRSQSSGYNTACAAGEVAVGGGGRCPSLWRLTESLPWGGSSDSSPSVNGQPATAWRAVCQVWGDAQIYSVPQNGVFAICCRQ